MFESRLGILTARPSPFLGNRRASKQKCYNAVRSLALSETRIVCAELNSRCMRSFQFRALLGLALPFGCRSAVVPIKVNYCFALHPPERADKHLATLFCEQITRIR